MKINWNYPTSVWLGENRVKDLAHAAILSDNSAANILMNLMDQKLNSVVQFARKAGDTKFRLDRWEPYLNTAIPGDLRDTTTAESTATAFTKISFGNAIFKFCISYTSPI